jgi:hypothetical protein
VLWGDGMKKGEVDIHMVCYAVMEFRRMWWTYIWFIPVEGKGPF